MTNDPTSPALPRLAEFAWLAIASTGVFLIPLLFNGRFYFYDDGQIQHLPAFYEIGRLLAHKEFPFLSLNAWYGGALLGEYQYGVLNPVTLLLSLIVYLFFGNIVAAATFVSITLLVILTTGVYAACRTMGCGYKPALIAAFGAGTGSCQLYWYANSWMPGMVGMAWAAWMVAAVLALRRYPTMRVLPALAIYMPLVSGWPQVIAGEAVFLGIVIVDAAIERRWRYFRQVIFLAAIGLLLAMPSLLPLAFYKAAGLRGMGWGGPIFAWLTPPAAWFGLGFPSFITTWVGWGNYYNYVDSPMTYVCWVLPIAAAAVFKERSAAIRDRLAWLLLILAVVYAGLATIPFPLPISFKWPFRFIPFVHLFLMLWLARVLSVRESAGLKTSGWSRPMLALCILIPFGLTVIGGSGMLNAHAVKFVLRDMVVALLLFGAGMLVIRADCRAQRHWMSMALAGQLVFFIAMIAIWPSPLYLHDWQLPAEPRKTAEQDKTLQTLQHVRGNVLFLYNSLWDISAYANPVTLGKPPWIDRRPWNLIGNTQFYYGVHAIHGYTPIEPAALQKFFCFGIFAATMCPESTEHLFSRDPATGAVYADLFKVDSIVAQSGPLNDAANKAIPESWPRTALGGGDTIYARLSDSPDSAGKPESSGTLSYLPPGLQATLLTFGERREKYAIKADSSYDGRPIVFARPWYPGYRVLADGKPLDYERLAGILIAARLPRNFTGNLEVVYTPLGFDLGVDAAAAAAVVLLGWSVIGQTRRRRAMSHAL